MQEVPDPASQRLDELAGALGGKADHVDHGVRPQREHPPPESALGLFDLAVQRYLLDGSPGGMDLVGLSPAATDRDHLVPGLDQPGHEESAHVPAAPYHHDAHQATSKKQAGTQALISGATREHEVSRGFSP